MFIHPIALANVVTEPDNVIVPAEATAGPTIGIIADASPDDEGMKIVRRATTKNIMKIAPTGGIAFNALPKPSPII
ncbi:MAG: hypothetical protein MJ195_01350 [Mycoplasmoidaceae bacterium]|nr:hypothetical protein [Mycoplasmoidaceae bacterium]